MSLQYETFCEGSQLPPLSRREAEEGKEAVKSEIDRIKEFSAIWRRNPKEAVNILRRTLMANIAHYEFTGKQTDCNFIMSTIAGVLIYIDELEKRGEERK